MIPKKYVAAIVASVSIAVGTWLASNPFARETVSAWPSTRLVPPGTTEPQPARSKVSRPRFAAMRCLACL